MSDQVMPLVRDAVADFVTALQSSRDATDDWTSPDVDDHVHVALFQCLCQLEETQLLGVSNQLPSSVLWKTADDFLNRGQLQTRARSKPRGYAGDFEMLRMICENYHCEDPLGRSFDRFFQAQAAPQAVRNRTQIVADRVVERVQNKRVQNSGAQSLRVVSLGSGPGIDMELAARRLGPLAERLHVTLIDIDPAGLQHAEQRLVRLLPEQSIRTHRANLGRVASNQRLLAEIGDADLICCTGLMDYLVEEDAISLTKALAGCLSDDGQLIIFNFSTDNPSRAYMEWIANWYLIYRTTEDMLRLGTKAGFSAHQLEVAAEDTGVNLYLTASK